MMRREEIVKNFLEGTVEDFAELFEELCRNHDEVEEYLTILPQIDTEGGVITITNNDGFIVIKNESILVNGAITYEHVYVALFCHRFFNEFMADAKHTTEWLETMEWYGKVAIFDMATEWEDLTESKVAHHVRHLYRMSSLMREAQAFSMRIAGAVPSEERIDREPQPERIERRRRLW